MKIYGDLISGNCLKVKYVCDFLAIPYNWVPVDVVAGEARTDAMKAKNPAGQVPFIELEDGRILSQSNAIMRFLAGKSILIPSDPFDEALMDQWLFWEQYSHETAIAVARFQVKLAGKPVSELDPALVAKGNVALDIMENHLSTRNWFAGDRLSLADIALVAYTQFAGEGGFSLKARTNIIGWIERVHAALGLA
jgi:glutathione S-transferase